MTALLPAVTVLAVCGPAFLAVCRLTARRAWAPLVRGSLERSCVLAAAGIAAISVTAQIGLVAAAFSGCDDSFTKAVWDGLLLFGLPCIAAAAWCAGEVLSGASRRSEPAFAAAVVASYASGVLAFGGAMGAMLAPGTTIACAAASSALASSAAYLAVRGPTPAR